MPPRLNKRQQREQEEAEQIAALARAAEEAQEEEDEEEDQAIESVLKQPSGFAAVRLASYRLRNGMSDLSNT